MARVKSKIEFFEGVPIPTDFKHSPIFNNKAAQKAFFDKYKKSSLTFEGSYQRVEEQIKTKFKYEQLLNVNYVHVLNPSYEGSPSDKHEWWGFVMDIHYINDGLVIVDWVVDPIQTFMFDWDLGKAFIERGMMRSHVVNNSRPETLYAINDKKISVFTNPEPVGVDGAAYYLDHDNLMRVTDDIESRITYMVVLIGDSENRSLVGAPSQIEYYVLPYDKLTGKLFDFEINNVKTSNSTVTVKSERNWRYNINDSIDALARDMGLTKGGQAVLTSYTQNEIGLDFEPILDDETGRYTLVATMHNREWRVSTKNTANIEVYDVLSKKVDDDDDGNNGGGDGGDDGGGSTDDKSTYVKVLSLTAKYEMGDRGSGYYHPPLDDGAGWNYGKYSFTQVNEMDNFLSWLNTNYKDIRDQLQGSVGSTTFNNSWAAYGDANDKKFTEVQAEYFCKTKLKPKLNEIKESTNVDFNDGNKALGSMSLISSIINWYPASIANGAWCNNIIKSYQNNWNDANWITETCDYIVANASSMVAAEYVQGIQNRFRNEKTDALALTEKIKLQF